MQMSEIYQEVEPCSTDVFNVCLQVGRQVHMSAREVKQSALPK